MSTASGTEVAWLTIVLIATGIALLMLTDAIWELVAIQRRGDATETVVLTGKMYAIVLALILLVAMVFDFVGWQAAVTPQGDTPVLNVAALLFIGVGLVKIGMLFVIRRYRFRIRNAPAMSRDRVTREIDERRHA